MEKKTILVVGPLSSGHIQNWIAPYLDEYDFVFVTLHNAKLPPEFDGCRTIVFPRITGTRLDFLFAIPLLQYWVAKIQPDIIHSHFLSSYGLMSAAVFTKCTKMLSVWGTDINGKINTNPLLKLLAKWAIKKYVWINAPAQHAARKLFKLGATNKQVDVFQYGIKIDSYPIKADLGKNEKIRFLSIRNWDALYNIEPLLLAYKKFGQMYPGESELVLVGRGSAERSIQIEKLVNKYTTDSAKISIAGFLNKKQLLSVLTDSDVVVSVPAMDGSPLSVLEAMYVGLYPLVSDIDANRELFDPQSATFVNPSNIDDFVSGYQNAFQQAKLSTITEAIELNRSFVIEHASYDKNTKKLKDMYNCLSL